MVWPFDDNIRPYMQMAAYWLGRGLDALDILGWAAGSRHHYNLADMTEAIPEARRATYFAERIRSADPTWTLAKIWGLASRATWYAGYGRAPTTAEREWAYTRPQGALGLSFEVAGRGARTGQYRHFTVTVNVPWSASLGAVEDFIRDQIASGVNMTFDLGSEPLRADSIISTLGGGALVQREKTTFTMPGV